MSANLACLSWMMAVLVTANGVRRCAAEEAPAPPPPAVILEDSESEPAGAAADATRLVESSVKASRALLPSSNLLAPAKPQVQAHPSLLLLRDALRERAARNYPVAEKMFIRLLEASVPEDVHKASLIELAAMAQEQGEVARAQQIYAQFVSRFPQDQMVPELLLRQGVLYRQMGAPVLALSKFYAVMSTSLKFRQDRLEYYQKLVLQAQAEIADTYYLQGSHQEAAEFFGRLLKLDNPELDRSRILHKMIRSLALAGRHGEVAGQAEAFLDRYPDADTAAEVRYFLADALKKLGRPEEATKQVLALLRSQERNAAEAPESWSYWRQRTGNELANQFYQEGDYLHALQIYQAIVALNSAPEWAVPALYQIGLVYERLRQPARALETYARILAEHGRDEAKRASPNLAAILEMAKWRQQFLSWQQRAEITNSQLQPALAEPRPSL